MLLQGFKNDWQKRDEAFGTNPIERLPDQHQYLFDLRSIPTTKYYRRREDLLCMIEQPLGIFARIPGGGHKFLQDVLLLGPRCLLIRRRNLVEQDPSGLRPQSVSHVFLVSIKQLRSRATDPLPLPHDSRPFVRSIALAHWFGQRSSARLWPRGSVLGSQREKGNG